MSEKAKPEAIREELTKEQLEGVSGGFNPVDGVIAPIKPPVIDFNPVDGNTLP
jgi:hypothetical protein